ALENRGRRECRVHDAPVATRAKENDARRLNTGPPKSSGIPCAMGLRLLRALPGEPAFLTVAAPCVSAARPKSHVAQLVPCIGGTGPHGLTVRTRAERL